MGNDGESRVDVGGSGSGATRILTRLLSEADLALFALVMGEATFDGETHLDAEPRYQQMAPAALLSALLTACAALHSEQPEVARFTSAQVTFIEPAYAEETVRACATVTDIDAATGALHIVAYCETEAGRRLADAEFTLRHD